MGTPCRSGRSRRRWRRWWRRRYQVLRAYARIRIAIVHIVRFSSSFSLLSPSSISSSSSSFSSFAAPSRVFPSTRFSRSLVGRSIATSADSALLRSYTYSYSRSTSPCKSGRGKGEPDLSPLNGINKLYYACTSPWNTIPAGGLVRTTGEGFVPSRLNPPYPQSVAPFPSLLSSRMPTFLNADDRNFTCITY